jgi:hypothetical protein
MSNCLKTKQILPPKVLAATFFRCRQVSGGNWRQLSNVWKSAVKSTTYRTRYLAAMLASTWLDHAAKPPHLYKVAATGGILAGGMVLRSESGVVLGVGGRS